MVDSFIRPARERPGAVGSPESLAYGPPATTFSNGNLLFIVGPVADGVLGVPRVFYGP
jgi:hypothetical protein